MQVCKFRAASICIGDEFFGEIIEFDDDDGTVTIETEDGEELTGDQDDMFLEDEDDE